MQARQLNFAHKIKVELRSMCRYSDLDLLLEAEVFTN